MLWGRDNSPELPLSEEMKSLNPHDRSVIGWRLSLGRMYIILGEEAPAGRGQFSEGDTAVSPLQPVLPVANGVNVIILKKQSGQHITVSTTDKV